MKLKSLLKLACSLLLAFTSCSLSAQTPNLDKINQRGVLATLAARIADAGSNIDDIVFEDKDGKSTTITFAIGVRDRKHLASIIRTLRANPNVLKASRMRT